MPSIGGRSREPQAKRGGYGRVDVGAVGRGVRCPRLTWASADGPPRKAASQAPTRIGDPCGVRTRDLHRDRVARTPLLQETKSVLQAGGRLPHPRPLVACYPFASASSRASRATVLSAFSLISADRRAISVVLVV